MPKIQETVPVSHKRSLAAAFAKQLKGKVSYFNIKIDRKVEVCPICEKTIALGIYRYHFDRCDLKIEEDECLVSILPIPRLNLAFSKQITDVVTASQKIGPPIVLDSSFEDGESQFLSLCYRPFRESKNMDQ